MSLLWGRILDCWSLKVSRVVDDGDGSSVSVVVSLIEERFSLRKRVLKTAFLPYCVA